MKNTERRIVALERLLADHVDQRGLDGVRQACQRAGVEPMTVERGAGASRKEIADNLAAIVGACAVYGPETA